MRNLAGFREHAAGLRRATGGTLPGGVPHRTPGWSTDMNTPWGKAETIRNIADGIDFVTTDRHGGFVLSDDRRADMPLELKALSFTCDRYFEEDFAWCAVPLAWPQFFTTEDFRVALETYRGGVRRGWARDNSATFRDADHSGMLRRLEAQLASMETANA